MQFAHARADALEALDIILAVDLARHEDGRRARMPVDVGRGDHADDLFAIHHRHMVNVPARHQQQRVEARRAHVDRERLGGRNADHRRIDVEPGGDDAVAQITVGDDADEPPRLDDQHRRHARGAHAHRGFAHRCAGVDRDRFAPQQRVYRRGRQRQARVAGARCARRCRSRVFRRRGACTGCGCGCRLHIRRGARCVVCARHGVRRFRQFMGSKPDRNEACGKTPCPEAQPVSIAALSGYPL